MAEVVRKGGLAVKMAKKDLHTSVESQVEQFLHAKPQDAYTINGILIDLLQVKPENLRGPWSTWPGKLPTLYGRVRRVLDRLYISGKVTRAKQGRAVFWAWKGE